MSTVHPREEQQKARGLVAQLTVPEKCALLSGSSFWQTEEVKRLGLEKITLSDGPHGLRKQADSGDHLGLAAAVPATCFPAAGTMAASWDRALCRQVGEALAQECVAERVAVILGPGMNIKRNPLGGRNFEYFSEDPHLTGELAAAFVAAVQSNGVGTSLKHFAANNQEHMRMVVDTVVDERTLRELYLSAFERVVVGCQPWTVMAAYNRLGGAWCSEHHRLLNTILRGEWGFRGLVVSDWGGVNDRVAGVEAGLDLEMPGSGGINDRKVLAAARSGALSAAALDEAATNVVALVLAHQKAMPSARASGEEAYAKKEALLKANHAIAIRAAIDSAVLLKNEPPAAGVPSGREGSGLLPLSPTGRLLVIGEFAVKPRYQGAGSSRINSYRVDAPLDEITRAVGHTGSVSYATGYDAGFGRDNAELIGDAVRAAREAESVVILAGLPGICECEGYDREHMRLPAQMDRLIEAVSAVNKRVAVVLLGGSPVRLPWVSRVPAVLLLGLPGDGVGAALSALLFGHAQPSGKLAETWPLDLSDCPSTPNFATHRRQVVYREGLNVGYRYFAGANVATHFPFGHGLSYTRFEYSELELAERTFQMPSEVSFSVVVANAGERSGSEVVQIYVRHLDPPIHRPDRELRDFAKVHLAVGARERLEFTLPPRAFAYYDVDTSDWRVEPGAYELLVCASSVDVRLIARVELRDSAAPRAPKAGAALRYMTLDDHGMACLGCRVPVADSARPYTRNTVLEEVGESGCIAGCVYKGLLWFARNVTAKGAAGLGDTEICQKMIHESLRSMPLRGLQNFSPDSLSDKVLDTIILALNNKCCSALFRLCCCYKPKAQSERTGLT